MGDPMFGWAAIEVITIIRVCDKLIKAYSNGPGGARDHFQHVQGQVQSCKKTLCELTEELESQDTKVYIRLNDIKSTLERCESLFNGAAAVYWKEEKERTVRGKLGAAVAYTWDGQAELDHLSRKLEGHMTYVVVYLQLLHRKSNKLQIAYHEKHSKYLEEILSRLEQVELLRNYHPEPHAMRSSTRSFSTIELPVGSSLSMTNAVVDHSIYEEGRKSYVDVKLFLDLVRSWEADDSGRDQEEMELLRRMKSDLDGYRKRLGKSIERNESKGAQIARAEMRPFETKRKPVPSRSGSKDSGYEPSVFNDDIYVSAQRSPGSVSRATTILPDAASEQMLNFNFPPILTSPRPSESPSPSARIAMIARASVAFTCRDRRRLTVPCTVKATLQDQCLQNIFPQYEETPSENLGFVEIPILNFSENETRPIPHVELRGKRAVQFLPNRFSVVPMGQFQIEAEVEGLEYIFAKLEDSKKFQEILFGKKIACYLEVSKISSNRGKESDNVILRVWQNPDGNSLKGSDFSLLFYANDEKRQEHIEAFLHEVDSLKETKKSDVVEMKFKKGTQSGERLGYLKIEFSRDRVDENQYDRANFVAHLDPKRKSIDAP